MTRCISGSLTLLLELVGLVHLYVQQILFEQPGLQSHYIGVTDVQPIAPIVVEVAEPLINRREHGLNVARLESDYRLLKLCLLWFGFRCGGRSGGRVFIQIRR